MKQVIVIEMVRPFGEPILEVWGSLTRACRAHPEFNYSKISRLKYPFEHQGFTFKKVNFNEKQETRQAAAGLV